MVESGLGVHPEVAIKEVAAAVATLNGVDFASLTDEQLADAVIALHTLSSSLEAATTRAVGVADAKHATDGDGARSIRTWIAWKCRVPSARAARTARNARALRHLPRIEEAFAAGVLTGDHVRLLAHAAGVNRAAFDSDTDGLLDHAKRLSYRQFARTMAYWCYVNARDDAEDKARQRHESRNAHCSETFEGTVVLNALFPAVGGALFANELRRLEQELFDADVRDAKARLGRSPLPGELARTAQQRRCDALIEMARRSAARPADTRSARPLFTVLLGHAAFKDLCELANGTVLTPSQLLPFLSDADIERIIFDGPSRIIDVGTRRLFRDAARRAIEVRDRTCWHPSCDIPADRCQIDHIQPWERGGPTIQTNGRSGCKYHHRRSHQTSRPPPDT